MSEDHSKIVLSELKGFRELFEERTNNIESTLGRLEVQVNRTNGRVDILELNQAEQKGKTTVTGAIWGGVSAIVISVITFFISKEI